MEIELNDNASIIILGILVFIYYMFTEVIL